MDINIKNISLFLNLFFMTSCAHYFSTKKKEKFFYSEVGDVKSICLYSASDYFSRNSKNVVLRSNPAFGKIIKKLEDQGIRVNCSDESDLDIYVIRNNKSSEYGYLKLDLFVFSLGVIPLKTERKFEIYSFAKHRTDPEYYSINEGYLWVSIFFAPVFFLHDDEADIFFAEIMEYLKSRGKILILEPR